MSTQSLYNQWSSQYDTNKNRTRDLEAVAVRRMLADVAFQNVLEIGAGTGKNTVWYASRAQRVLAVDLSEGMLALAKEKIEGLGNSGCVTDFQQADVTQAWTFGEAKFDLVCFSLVLEHLADLEAIFLKAAMALASGGHLYLGELHPGKQYLGTKARFEEGGEVQVLECHLHHVSDFWSAAKAAGLELVDVQEFFDEGDRNGVPRILGMVFRKLIGDS
ncbi:MAG: class I SAM-dependent methyltransferase [Bacteroidia bacterium]